MCLGWQRVDPHARHLSTDVYDNKLIRVNVCGQADISEGGNKLAWLCSGVPEMVIRLISMSDAFSTDDDDVVSECLSVAIILLKKGKQAAQDAFYKLFTSNEKNSLFHHVRERLIRAERGLATFAAVFEKYSTEMADECEAHGHSLTIFGESFFSKSWIVAYTVPDGHLLMSL